MAKMSTLALGDFFFGEHTGSRTTKVYAVNSITVRDARFAADVGEAALSEAGNESYIVLEVFRDKLSGKHGWWCRDDEGGYVAFDKSLRPVSRHRTRRELATEHPDARPVGDMSKKFRWRRWVAGGARSKAAR
jgi:hypothetical protein